ncbi:SDR family NAD(P)-dependent oxidoreductase [Dyadobacter sp. NIV53]|uniref:SDR family NAD(P)-dependent oxidoreductase n=1 Tax=Dyadobacter sp. NIV53 TaxID=2861765 RepID=UPI001C883346|nr:SDR family oxidoreductase [Dyadobacter sp. NIV53]
MKNFVIIGASSGIGKQLASQLSKTEATVFGTFYKTENTDSVSLHYLNVLDENADLSFLPDTIDGLAYCPGSINLKPFARIKPEEFLQDYQLQVLGAIKIIQALLPKLKKPEHASIVLFSTVAVQTGFNYHTIVAASKGAIEGLTRALAAELAPNIRVNCIAPSITDTPLAATLLSTDEKKTANAQRHPLKKIGSVGDIANMAEFLLTDKSAWITGQIFQVDGGMSGLR